MKFSDVPLQIVWLPPPPEFRLERELRLAADQLAETLHASGHAHAWEHWKALMEQLEQIIVR